LNLLMLVHRIPYPPNKGEKLRAYHELRHLAERHNVWLACFVDEPADLQHAETLRQWCRDVAAIPLNKTAALLHGGACWLLGGTLTEGYFHAAALSRTLRTWGQQVSFDCALAYSSSMARYALDVRASRRVLDFVDLDSAKWRAYAQQRSFPASMVFAREAARLAEKERAWAARFDASVFITPAEAADLTAPEAAGKVHVVGNGVNPPSEAPAALPHEPNVGFVGMMDYFPNVEAVCWFVRQVWPLVRAKHGDATFWIVGRAPSAAVRALADTPGVRVTGAVEDVSEYLAKFRVSVAPFLTARGLQNKVLEAMAARRPVVVTSMIARSLRGSPGDDFLAASSPSDFADRVSDLLIDDDLAARIAERGAELVRTQYRWETEMEKLSAIVEGASPA
jgi:sugar transferase (PEP-CTERM/EpsH1 system associated)